MLTKILSTIAMWCGLSALLVNLGASVSWSLIMSTIATAWTYWILEQIYKSPQGAEQDANRSRNS